MKYIELTVHTSTFGSELVSDILWEYSQGGVAINDINDVIELSNSKRAVWDYIDDEVLNASKVVLCKGFLELETAEEVISETRESLKGAKPTAEQEKQIAKELKRATNLRSACQAANLGVSLVLLGLIIPIFTRNQTKKKHAEAIREAESNSNLALQPAK